MDLRNIEQRKQQVLYRHELMTMITRSLKSVIQAIFQFAT
jgi:hypothetical protein